MNIGAQRGTGGDLSRRQRLQQCRIVDHQGGQGGRGDRPRDQCPRGLLHHRAQIDNRSSRTADRLVHGDPEQSQLGNAVVDRSPGVGLPVLDIADGVGSATTGCPTANQVAGGELFVGDGRRHRRLLRFGGV